MLVLKNGETTNATCQVFSLLRPCGNHILSAGVEPGEETLRKEVDAAGFTGFVPMNFLPSLPVIS